jgi:hypothetical protein
MVVGFNYESFERLMPLLRNCSLTVFWCILSMDRATFLHLYRALTLLFPWLPPLGNHHDPSRRREGSGKGTP